MHKNVSKASILIQFTDTHMCQQALMGYHAYFNWSLELKPIPGGFILLMGFQLDSL